MKEKDVRQIAKRLLEIVHHAKDANFEHGKRHLHFERSQGGFSLVGEYADKYEALLAYLLEHHNWQEKYSEKHLSGLLQDAIVQAFELDKPEELEKLIAKMAKAYESYSREHKALVPLDGIRLEVRSLKIGNVTLRTFSENTLRNEVAKVRRVIQTTPYSKETQAEILTERIEYLQQLRGKVVAQYSVIAEPKRASERAEDETRRIIDLLRFAIPALYNDDLNVTVGLDGDISNSTYRIIPVSSAEIQSVHLYFARRGSLSHLEINKKNIKKMEAIGIFQASSFLANPANQISNFEETILQGLHWFATAMTQSENANKLLNMMTVLETFLTPRDNNPIGTAIAEGVAIIRGKSLADRKKIKTTIKDFYQKRSGLSHGGRKAVLDQEIVRLRYIVGSTIVWMIKNKGKFQTQKDLLNWIEDKKLS